MLKNFIRKKIFTVLVVMAVCGLLIFLNPYHVFNPIRNIMLAISYPFQKVMYFSAVKIRNGKELLTSIGRLKKDNDQLKEANDVLLAETVELVDLRKENEELRKQLELLPRGNYDLQSAALIGQDASGANSWILIDQGENKGLKKGMSVIISRGNLVGRVEEVQGRTAKVNLITHPESIINAETSGTAARGVIRGEFGLGVTLDMVVSTEKLESGDKIFTSGIGGDVSRGFYIGTVKESFVTGDGLFRRASVIPAVDFSKLQYVFVVKGTKEQ